MFDQINGLPVHVLVVHAAVVFVPLLALSAVVYALVPRLRARVGWVAALLAVAAPVVAFVAKQSGEAFLARKPAELQPSLQGHVDAGGMTVWWTLGLGVVTLVTVFLTSRRPLPKVAEIGLIVLTLVLAAGAAWFVFQTGDSGARSVHGG